MYAVSHAQCCSLPLLCEFPPPTQQGHGCSSQSVRTLMMGSATAGCLPWPGSFGGFETGLRSLLRLETASEFRPPLPSAGPRRVSAKPLSERHQNYQVYRRWHCFHGGFCVLQGCGAGWAGHSWMLKSVTKPSTTWPKKWETSTYIKS